MPLITYPNLALLRDRIRRKMQVQPAIDMTPPGPSGQPNPAQPDPPNSVIDEAVNSAVGRLNRSVRCDFQQGIGIAVGAQGNSWRGPYFADFSGTQNFQGQVWEVHSMNWDDGSGNPVRLQIVDYYEPRLENTPFDQYKPGNPRQYYMAGYQVALLPAPSVAGTLYMTFRQGLPKFVKDTDYTILLPPDLQVFFVDAAVEELSGIMTMDAEAKERRDYYGAKAQQQLQQIVDWAYGYKQNYIPPVVVHGREVRPPDQ